MASNALTVFDPKAGAPAHVAHFFEDSGTNIQPRTTVPSLSPQGKMWTVAVDGQKTPLQRRNTDGDLEPMPIMKVVVLDYAKQRGRAYYEGTYDPTKESAPICWSDDGVAPHASLPGPFAAGTQVEPGSARKISAACANCPMAIKGSKVDDRGKAMVACSQHRMLAVLPDPALRLPTQMQVPLRLKIAITSDWDKQSPDQEQQGWMAFQNYVDWLLARGVTHTAALVTKMKFDPNAAYPKIFFNAERYLEADELAVVGPMTKSDEVKKLLGGTWTPAGPDGVPVDQQHTAQPTPATDQSAPPATTYTMAADAGYTREQFHASGWTDEQLIAAGKMVATAAAPAPATPPPPATAPEPAAPAAEAVVVGEEPAAAVVVETTATVAAASPPAAEAVVVDDAPAAASPAAAAPVDPPAQEPAQAAAPPPAAAPPAPEPPAAAAKAAEAAPAASTEVPEDLAGLLQEWGG